MNNVLTENQILQGFWYWDIHNDWPPRAITEFEDYRPSERLNLNITQLKKTPYQQKKIVAQWCRELPNLKDVKYLWFSSKVNQDVFDAVCKMSNLRGLYIKWSSIKSIDNLRLLKQLRHLHLGSSSQVESIDVIGELGTLVTLELQQLNRVSDFSIVSGLKSLEGLGIDGSIWTAQKIDTLKPLEESHNLRYVTLTNTKVHDKSLDPILRLDKLVRFDSSWNFPEAEFEKLNSMSKLKYSNGIFSDKQ